MGGVSSGEKRVKADLKENSSIICELRQNIFDLQFIVKHLREDVEISLQQGRKSLNSAIEREIGLLVYSLREEQVYEQLKMKDLLDQVQVENKLLMENECALMDELARLVLENDRLKQDKTKPIIMDEAIILELERLIIDDGFFEKVKKKLIDSVKEINDLKLENEELKGKDLELIELKSLLEKEKAIIARLTSEIEIIDNEKRFNIEEREMLKGRLVEAKDSISVLEAEIQELRDQHAEGESRIRQLMTVNCELMDSLEVSKKANSEIKISFDKVSSDLESFKEEIVGVIENLKRDFELEKNILREEMEMEKEALIAEIEDFDRQKDQKNVSECESLKKIITAQKIEIEKLRETLNRERKLTNLKISDLQEQIIELKDGECKENGVDGNIMRSLIAKQ